MFQALSPLVAERNVHILLSAAADGRIAVYVEPVLKDKESGAFASPFRCEALPTELDQQFSAVLSNWIASRTSTLQSLTDALAAAEAATKKAAEDAKKAAKNKTTTPSLASPAKKDGKVVPPKAVPAKATVAPMPSLLDGIGDDPALALDGVTDEEPDDEGEGSIAPAATEAVIAAPAPAPAAIVEAAPAPAAAVLVAETPAPAPVAAAPAPAPIVATPVASAPVAVAITPVPAAAAAVEAPAVTLAPAPAAVVALEGDTVSLF